MGTAIKVWAKAKASRAPWATHCLMICALALMAVLSNAWHTGDPPWRAISHGLPAVAGVDLGLLVTAVVAGRELRPWRPQRWALQLLGVGSKPRPQAVAFWGPWALGPSPLLWRWKQAVDRRFMAGFSELKAMGPDGGAAMACRGCAAKLAASPLQDALARNGLGGGTPGSAEDAAVIAQALSHGAPDTSPVSVFSALRLWKNEFKA